ncbi:hypothetical protein RI129_013046 [Pyrocoelia pectoralis]|uniref:SWIM-type domain-containing protein n=1 Tax=Pyrocoelia pectoralis TaxID=417401 RepID=A0AAN7ZFK5_9COLE
MHNYSDYYKTLDREHSSHYLSKISIVNIDPYSIKLRDCSDKVEDYPNVLYPDIVNYLLYTKSAYTHQQLKAYKGLDAYKQANSGWVREVLTKRCCKKIVVLGRVMHSQRISENCTNTWIITEDSGCVLSAHCDCVAGLGETCTHICAILFFIDQSLRKQTEKSVTDLKSQWVIPSKIGAPDKVANIDFGLSKTCFDDKPLHNRNKKITNKRGCSRQGDVVEFLSKLNLGNSVLHTIVKPFSSKIHEQLNVNKSACLTRLYEIKHEIDTLENLQNIGKLCMIEKILI